MEKVLKSELLELLEKEFLISNFGNIEHIYWVEQFWVCVIVYLGKITYDSTLILRKLLNNSSQSNLKLFSLNILSSLIPFTNFYIAQPHIYIVETLKILKRNVDN